MWIFLICRPISNSSSPLWRLFQGHKSQLVSLSFSCSTTFSVLRQGQSTCLFFHFLCFWLSGLLEQQIPQDSKFSLFLFFSFLLISLKSGLLTKIRSSVRISKSQRNLSLILSDGLWFLNILFAIMVNFLSLAQFSVNYFPHSFVPNFVLLLC